MGVSMKREVNGWKITCHHCNWYNFEADLVKEIIPNKRVKKEKLIKE